MAGFGTGLDNGKETNRLAIQLTHDDRRSNRKRSSDDGDANSVEQTASGAGEGRTSARKFFSLRWERSETALFIVAGDAHSTAVLSRAAGFWLARFQLASDSPFSR